MLSLWLTKPQELFQDPWSSERALFLSDSRARAIAASEKLPGCDINNGAGGILESDGDLVAKS
jgi:hypothetical protein